MSFIVPLPETLFQNKIKEVSVISYSTDEDLEHVKNAYRLVVVPPFKISEASEMLNSYGMVLLGVQAVVDKCGIWIDKESEEDNPCEQDIVLFLIFSPAHTNMHEVEIQDALAKIKKLAGLKA